eukprot:COSAG05_NODE_19302_length_294_cov_8.087179_1_plen_27_part_01
MFWLSHPKITIIQGSPLQSIKSYSNLN